MSRARGAAFAIAGLLAIAGVVVAVRTSNDAAPCGDGFTRDGPRCCPARIAASKRGSCAVERGAACPSPLVPTDHGCDAPEHDVVDVPATTVIVGPSDWEAEGRVPPRTAVVAPFAIDRFEVTAGRACAHVEGASFCDASDPSRAASGVSFEQARAYCRARGGRLPTDDEWLAAAGGDRPRRYPWGDTGAVCRRAAWGLESGPCGEGATGPDTVGSHPEGATPLGIHDLAGNVAEWVEAPCPDLGLAPEPPAVVPQPPSGTACPRVVRGGAWKTRLATELRTWLRREASAESVRGGDPTIGFRCAYDRAPSP